MTVSTCFALPAHAAEIARIEVAAWRAAYRGIIPDDYLAKLDVSRGAWGWFQILQQWDEKVLLLVVDSNIVGFCDLSTSVDADACEKTAEITALYLDPAFWRKGYGRVLVEAAKTHLWSVGCEKLTLWVLRGNQQARGFYEALGFRPDGAEKVETDMGFDADQVRYRLDRGSIGGSM